MYQTLFHIPHQLGGIPVFGWGWALGVWILISAFVLWSSYRRHGFGLETKSQIPILGIFAFVLVAVLPRLEGISATGQGVPIRGFGVMLLIAVVSAVGLAVHRARRLSFDHELVYALATWVFVSGIVGARFFYVVQKWDEFGPNKMADLIVSVLNVTQGGIVIYGGLIGGAIGFAVFVLRNRLPPLAIADLIAPSLLLGMAIGRIGCFLNGCCYGGACELPWAVTFPPEAPPYIDQLRSGALYGLRLSNNLENKVMVAEVDDDSAAARAGLRVGDQLVRINGRAIAELAQAGNRPATEIAGDLLQMAKSNIALQTADGRTLEWKTGEQPARSRPVHPTQIYSTLNALVICIFLLAYFPFQRRDGESLAWFMVLYPISRFMLEIIRTDEQGIWGTGLTISQNISILVLLASVPVWFYLLRRPRGTVWKISARNPKSPLAKMTNV